MTSSDREAALLGGAFLLLAGTAVLWFAVRQFRDPVGTTNALGDRLGGRLLPDWLRPRPQAYPGLIRGNAVLVGLGGVLLVAIGVFALWRAFVW